MKTIIEWNGSKWHGQDPDPIEKLIANLGAYTLTCTSEWRVADYEECADKGLDTAVAHHFFGNFEEYSAAFSVWTDDPAVVEAIAPTFRKRRA